MKILPRSRWIYGTACVCGLYAAVYPLPIAAETVMNDAPPPDKLWVRRPVNADIPAVISSEEQAPRKVFSAQTPPPTPAPAPVASTTLPNRKVLLPNPAIAEAAPAPQPAAPPLKIVIPNLQQAKQVRLPAHIPLINPSPDYNYLAYTPVPPRMTPMKPHTNELGNALADLPSPLNDMMKIANRTPSLTPKTMPIPIMTADTSAIPTTSVALYQSPGIVIHKSSLHLIPPAEARADSELKKLPNVADLAPAAGGSDPNAIVPLIPVPTLPAAEKSQEAAMPSPPPATAATPALPPVSPVESATAPPPAEQAPIPPAPAVVADQNATPPSPTPEERYNAAALNDFLKNIDIATMPTMSERPDTLPITTSSIGKSSPAVTKPTMKMEATEKSPGDPEPSLSTESNKIADKIPSSISKQKKGADNFSIERAKDTKYVSKTVENEKPAPADTTKHEAMGIKLEVKKSAINFNYELEKAYNALISGHTEAAVEIYKNIITNDPNNRLALFGLATTYHRASQLDMARPLYGKLLALEPNNRDALNNFLVLLADESPQEALAQMEKLEERNPEFSPIPAQMAVIYQKMGNADKASEKMFRAIALAPENLTYRYNLAIMLDKQRKYEEAAKLYKQLMEAYMRGEIIPGNAQKIQERLTFISSNRH